MNSDIAIRVKTHPVSPVLLSWKGADLFLLPERAIFLEQSRTLLVADMHLGKDEAFRASGIPVPLGPGERTLDRLSNVLDDTHAQRLVILGDLLHAPLGNTQRVFNALDAWRQRYSQMSIILVRGNHDHFESAWQNKLKIEIVDTLLLDGLTLNHTPTADGTTVVCGHVAVRLK